MPDGWSDIYEELPNDGDECWVRAGFGCLPPLKMIYFVGGDIWTIQLPDSTVSHPPFWAYRYWKLA